MARFALLTLALFASLITSGCCSLEAISCRYSEAACATAAVGCGAPSGLMATKSVESDMAAAPCQEPSQAGAPCLDRLMARGALLHHGLRGSLYWPETPAGLSVPQPKFHPVPTRPVFEPRPEYAAPLLLEAPPHAFLPVPEEAAETLPTPASQPAVDQPPAER